MRWLKDPLKSKEDEERVIKKFLWFPRCLNGEYRWLESVKVLQRATRVCGCSYFGGACFTYKWVNVGWINGKVD